MRYLVTGVTGQLGYDVVRILKENGVTDIYNYAFAFLYR